MWGTRGGGFGPGGPSPAPPALNLRTVASSVGQYPALADALQLDDTQKKLAAALGSRGNPWGGFGGPPSSPVYLTPKQSEAAKAFLGAEFKGKLAGQYDTRPARSAASVAVAAAPAPALRPRFSPSSTSARRTCRRS